MPDPAKPPLFRPFPLIGLLLFCLLGALAEGHLPVDTNLAVDFEIEGNLLTIEPWMPTFTCPPMKEITFENEAEWPTADELREAIEDYFDEVCPVEIDGVRVRPQMQKLQLVPMEQAKHIGDVIDFVESRTVLHYPTESPPKRIKFRWSIFPQEPADGWGEMVEADPNHDPQEFDLMMFVDRKEDYVYFSPKEPEFFWHRKPEKVEKINVISPGELAASSDGKVSLVAETEPQFIPVISWVAIGMGVGLFLAACFTKLDWWIRVIPLVIGGWVAFSHMNFTDPNSPTPLVGVEEDKAVDIFKQLQANLYKAFDFETEDQIYDVLSQSVDGELLDDVYTEVYQSLLVVDKSKAVCKVHEVEVLECDAKAIEPGEDGKAIRFEISCHWRVHGVVDHFEHIHRRVNEYRADYRLTRKDNGWKITAVAVRQQDRLDPKTMQPSKD